MDIIKISQLKINTVIGAYAWEQQISQTVSLDLEFAADMAATTADDELDARTDYASVASKVSEYVSAKQTALLETLAESIAQFCLQDLGLSWVRLSLSKPGAIPNAGGVSISITRPGE